MLQQCYVKDDHMPSTLCEIMSPVVFKFLQELKREQKMGFLQAM